ncbi:MAG TPA: hypothetical protein DEH78_07335, partial [Solibacterales bacterium]|nr:hypothetical protein [Bryobacterales bacterium]
LAGSAAAGSFRASLESLAGKADFEVSAIGGLAPETLAALAALPAPLTVRARIEDYALLERTRETVPLIGLDMVAEAFDFDTGGAGEATWRAESVWVGPRLARRAGETLRLTVNDKIAEFTVAGILKETPGSGEAGNVVVMDLATADRVLSRHGRLDRLLIEAPAAEPLEHWEALLAPAVPAGATLARFGARTEENRKMLAAFRWNLRVLSYIALVVGAFLIYNTVSVSVVRRRAEIGIFRALGATRAGVLAAFLGEAALFGLTGAGVGLLLGRAMAEGAVRLLGATVESLYVSSTPGRIEIGWEAALLSLLVGLGVSLASSLAPALEASRVTPVEAMARAGAEHDTRVHKLRDLLFGALLALAAAAASRMPPIGGKPLFGYAAALLLIAAAALAIPALVAALSRVSGAGLRRALGVEALLASRSLAASLRRTSVLVGALATAIAMMASVGIMVGSFRETVLLWMDSQLRADLYLRPAGPAAADRHPTMSAAVAEAIERVPGVAAVDRFRARRISYHGLPVTLGAGETSVAARHSRTRFLEGDRAAILRRLPTGDFVIVSEPFANKHAVRRGDRISLTLGGATRPFEVLGIYYDYASERGYIVMDRATMLKYLPDRAPSNLAVFLAPGADLEATRTAIERATAGSSLLILANRTIRTEAIRIFDRTFAITYALEAVAVVVAVMGIAGALLALVIDRRRELGLLRFLGASQPQIRRLILCEAGLIGLLANAAGLTLGAALSLILIFVINKQSFGWTIQFHWPVAVLTGALSLIYAATLLAGLYPARVAMALNPMEAVHEE